MKAPPLLGTTAPAPPAGAERGRAKTAKTGAGATPASTARAARQADGEDVDETVGAVALPAPVERIGDVDVDVDCGGAAGRAAGGGLVGRDDGRDDGRDGGRADDRDVGRDDGRDLGRDDGRDFGRCVGRDGGSVGIAGVDDRAHHLSLKGAQVAVAPRPPAAAGAPLIAPRQPLSRAECRRRCGKAGFCDPSSELGCGGEYCGNRYAF